MSGKGRRRTTNRRRQEERRLSVRAERRRSPDVKKLSRAFIGLAMARAKAEADAQAQQETPEQAGKRGRDARP